MALSVLIFYWQNNLKPTLYFSKDISVLANNFVINLVFQSWKFFSSMYKYNEFWGLI